MIAMDWLLDPPSQSIGCGFDALDLGLGPDNLTQRPSFVVSSWRKKMICDLRRSRFKGKLKCRCRGGVVDGGMDTRRKDKGSSRSKLESTKNRFRLLGLNERGISFDFRF